jgi:hypothetical protein
MHVPFTGSITEMKDLSDDRKAVGMLNWLSFTVRAEMRHGLSRISQHLAKPNQGIFDAVVRMVRYLATTPTLALRQELNLTCRIETVLRRDDTARQSRATNVVRNSDTSDCLARLQ